MAGTTSAAEAAEKAEAAAQRAEDAAQRAEDAANQADHLAGNQMPQSGAADGLGLRALGQLVRDGRLDDDTAAELREALAPPEPDDEADRDAAGAGDRGGAVAGGSTVKGGGR